jgi:hypothetical protein
MDLMLFSFPILFFCIQGYKKERKIKDAFKGVIPGLIVSLILMAVVLFVKDKTTVRINMNLAICQLRV